MNEIENILPSIYKTRFTGNEEFRLQMWKELCKGFFQQYISKDAVVAEVACGYCEFINNIVAKKKYGIDLNSDSKKMAAKDVEVLIGKSTELSRLLPDQNPDVLFSSNFFEHIPRSDILETFKQAYEVLKPGGTYLILQPNIRFCFKDYWQFFDHITPIDDRALCEALKECGFEIALNIPKFLPYTTQSRLPNSIWLVKLYIRLPWLWPLFGKQSFIIARKTGSKKN